ncbi:MULTISPECIES: hypothetical protein [Prochlorococcus]|uniref:hypothetical protein n=1 Tax=Prochlorococcus TaxID=1218 RepID=UPI000517678A|nr:hypothetical protein [Prochlorococcus marinus]
MIFIITSALIVALGSYLLRRGDLLGLILIFFRDVNLTRQDLIFTLSGIALNILAILLWQYSSKYNIQFQLAWSIYLSLSLLFGYIFGYLFERNRLEINFYIGAALVIGGLIILVKK